MTNDYTIYLNKKTYKVSYLIYLCHLTGRFNSFQSKDIYNKFFCEFRFNTKEEIISFILNLNLPLENINLNFKNSIYKMILEGGLFYIYVLTTNFLYCLDLNQYKKLGVINIKSMDILNTSINYIKFDITDDFSLLRPYLKFYKYLSFYTNTVYINLEDINLVLKDLNIKKTDIDIIDSLNKHMIILPYENKYIWSSNLLLKQLQHLPINTVNSLCINYLLSN